MPRVDSPWESMGPFFGELCLRGAPGNSHASVASHCLSAVRRLHAGKHHPQCHDPCNCRQEQAGRAVGAQRERKRKLCMRECMKLFDSLKRPLEPSCETLLAKIKFLMAVLMRCCLCFFFAPFAGEHRPTNWRKEQQHKTLLGKKRTQDPCTCICKCKQAVHQSVPIICASATYSAR